MKIDFTTLDIIEIQDEIIEEFAADRKVISTCLIDFILQQARENNFNKNFFTILGKILRVITIDHPFIVGNKRIGLVIIMLILQDNNLILDISEKEKEEFILEVASLKLSIEKNYLGENSSEY